MIAAHSSYPGLHRVLLDEAPIGDDYLDPHSAFEMEYLSDHRAAVATYRARPASAIDEIVALIISDAIDGVIHNAVRRGILESPDVKRELVRMISAYLDGANA